MIRMPDDSRGRTLLRGCGTALATPFTRSGDLDEKALRAFVEWQVAEGIHFVVPCGSTGEANGVSDGGFEDMDSELPVCDKTG